MNHRVRTVIPYLDYGDLSKRKLIPKERMFTAKTIPAKGGKTPCPTLAKKIGASQYGLFVEKIVELLLRNPSGEITSVLAPLKAMLPAEIAHLFKPEAYSPLAKMLAEKFKDPQSLSYQTELVDSQNNTAGHPDILGPRIVYDIKTTGRFARMRVSTIFQLLSYFCLCQIEGKKVYGIGLILPLQLNVITYNLNEWNWRPFYEEFLTAIHIKLVQIERWAVDKYELAMYHALVTQFVGGHVEKKDLVAHVNAKLPALQFFVSGNTNATVSYTPAFAKELATSISKSPSSVYIHSPYLLNLSFPGKHGKDGPRSNDAEIATILGNSAWGGWTFDCLRRLFEFGIQVGIKGIVVHCGKMCGQPENVAVCGMLFSTIACAKYASPECKLLIETSSGDGGEIMCSPEDLGSFYLALPPETQANVGICVDTCHVFAAGYDPYDYVLSITSMGVPIDLFHYNDSAFEMGTKKDRHAHIGGGFVGYEPLKNIMQFAVERRIPMVRE